MIDKCQKICRKKLFFQILWKWKWYLFPSIWKIWRFCHEKVEFCRFFPLKSLVKRDHQTIFPVENNIVMICTWVLQIRGRSSPKRITWAYSRMGSHMLNRSKSTHFRHIISWRGGGGWRWHIGEIGPVVGCWWLTRWLYRTCPCSRPWTCI